MDSHFITVSVSIPAELAKIILSRDCPHAITLYPEQIRAAIGEAAPDPRDRFSDSDVLIAELLDKHGPLTAGEIRARLESEHDHLISDDSSIRRRFGKGMPLRDAGYHSTPRGYAAP